VRISLVRSVAITFALPIFLHAHLLLGFLLTDPVFLYGGLGSTVPGPLNGLPTIDPNVGFVDQALTARAAASILSGSFPWWNPFEGFGVPLAGEMQCSALFPLALLIALPGGSLLINVVVQIIAGLGMVLLLRRCGLADWAALIGAVTFEMCGTFAWLSGAWSYSIPWLPLLLLGIEYLRMPGRRAMLVGSLVLASSLAMLIYAGFIETSFLEGLVGIAWTIARLVTDLPVGRLIFLRRLGFASAIGLALGTPILVAFIDALAISYVGMHDASSGGGSAIPSWVLIQKLVPYVYGPIFASRQPNVGAIWGNTGGYLGFALSVAALAGVVGPRLRPLRIVCAIVVVFGLTAILGGPLQKIWLLIPGVKYTAYYRYIDPAMAFAASMLAALALDDLSAGLRHIRRTLAIATVGLLAVLVFATHDALPQLAGATAEVDAFLSGWHAFSFGVVVVACAGIGVAIGLRDRRASAIVLGLTVSLEAALFLVIPTLSYPSSATIGTSGLSYLKHHLGNQRVYSLGPLGLNYGSYFGIADLDYADVPVPALAVNYIKKYVDVRADPYNFYSTLPRPGMSQRENVVTNLRAFASVGVKYVLAPPQTLRSSPQLHAVYRDATMDILEVKSPAAYFQAAGCRLDVASRTSLSATCSADATLCRLELNVPGWTAVVGGVTHVPTMCNGIFQSIRLPAGTSSIAYRYAPPHIEFALIAAALAACALGFMLYFLFRSEPSARGIEQREGQEKRANRTQPVSQ